MSSNILITIKKELRSIFRDRKTLINIFLLPLIIPVFVFFYGYVYDQESYEDIYTIGVDYNLSEDELLLLDSYNLEISTYKDINAMKEKYENGDIYGYISYNEAENKYLVYTNPNETDGMIVNELINQYLKDYSTLITNNYLVQKGIDLNEVYNTFLVENIEIVEGNMFLEIILSLAFTYVIMAICLATSSMAISTTATERENGTLETILTLPITKNDLVIGKYLSAVLVGISSALFGLIVTLVSISSAKGMFDIYKTISLDLSLLNILLSIVIIILASLFIAGVALSLTAFSKSYKEAQSSTQLLSMVSIIPMFVSLMQIEITSIFYFIPVFNYVQILMDLFNGTVVLINVIITILSTIIFIVVIIKYIISAYNSEKVLFSN